MTTRHFLHENKKYLLTLIGIVIVAVYLFPLYWIFANSLKSASEVFASPPIFFPKNVDFSSYQSVIEGGILKDLLNSFIIAVPTTLFTIIMGTLSAYAIARSKLHWINWLIIVFLLSQLMPPVLMATPLFVFLHSLGLINTYIGVVLSVTTLTLPFFIVIVRPAFLSTPIAIEESAKIDGCSTLGILVRIAIPICKPSIAVASAISFLWSFANFVFPVSLLTKQEMFPTMVKLYSLVGAQTTRWDMIMSYSVITLIPAIVIFLGFHKHLMEGMTAGSVK